MQSLGRFVAHVSALYLRIDNSAQPTAGSAVPVHIQTRASVTRRALPPPPLNRRHHCSSGLDLTRLQLISRSVLKHLLPQQSV